MGVVGSVAVSVVVTVAVSVVGSLVVGVVLSSLPPSLALPPLVLGILFDRTLPHRGMVCCIALRND